MLKFVGVTTKRIPSKFGINVEHNLEEDIDYLLLVFWIPRGRSQRTLKLNYN